MPGTVYDAYLPPDGQPAPCGPTSGPGASGPCLSVVSGPDGADASDGPDRTLTGGTKPFVSRTNCSTECGYGSSMPAASKCFLTSRLKPRWIIHCMPGKVLISTRTVNPRTARDVTPRTEHLSSSKEPSTGTGAIRYNATHHT